MRNESEREGVGCRDNHINLLGMYVYTYTIKKQQKNMYVEKKNEEYAKSLACHPASTKRITAVHTISNNTSNIIKYLRYNLYQGILILKY